MTSGSLEWQALAKVPSKSTPIQPLRGYLGCERNLLSVICKLFTIQCNSEQGESE